MCRWIFIFAVYFDMDILLLIKSFIPPISDKQANIYGDYWYGHLDVNYSHQNTQQKWKQHLRDNDEPVGNRP